MEKCDVKIVSDGIRAKIYVNGQEINKCTSYIVSHWAAERPEVTITLAPDVLEFTASEADTEIDNEPIDCTTFADDYIRHRS